MNQQQRAVIVRTLQITAIFVLGCCAAGVLIALFGGVRDPFAFLLLTVGWGVVGLWSFAVTAGWPTGILLAVLIGWLYFRAGRVPDPN